MQLGLALRVCKERFVPFTLPSPSSALDPTLRKGRRWRREERLLLTPKVSNGSRERGLSIVTAWRELSTREARIVGTGGK
jgi:hypothetical protein